MKVSDSHNKTQKKKKRVSEVEKAKVTIKAVKEKEKKAWIKIAREAAKAGRSQSIRVKNEKWPRLKSIKAFEYPKKKKNRSIGLLSWFL